jgi:hypothetical protein
MTATLDTARRLLERTGEHPVVSVFLDLDPSQFGTAPARATQLRSLLDEAGRSGTGDASLSHEDRTALREDLARLERYLQSDEPPVSGARALAVFCSGRDGLFEAVQLPDAAPPKVVVARTPYVEPLVAGHIPDRWCVALVSRRSARLLAGDVPELDEAERVTDNVHRRHNQGGWSQANYQRSIDHDAEQHLRHVADELYRAWQREPFARLVLGGPEEDVDRFAELLHNDLRPTLSDVRLAVDVESSSVADVREALGPVFAGERAAAEARALAELGSRLAGDGAAASGLAPTLDALGQRRVETLVLSLNFAAAGARCRSCGLLYADASGSCPADGDALEPVPDIREAAVEAAVLQDAAVVVIGEGSQPPPSALAGGGGIAAVLRF